MSVHNMLDWCLRRLEEGVGFPAPGVTDTSEQLLETWESDPGTLKEQPVVLIVTNLSSPRFLKFWGIFHSFFETEFCWSRTCNLLPSAFSVLGLRQMPPCLAPMTAVVLKLKATDLM